VCCEVSETPGHRQCWQVFPGHLDLELASGFVSLSVQGLDQLGALLQATLLLTGNFKLMIIRQHCDPAMFADQDGTGVTTVG